MCGPSSRIVVGGLGDTGFGRLLFKKNRSRPKIGSRSGYFGGGRQLLARARALV